MEARTHAPRRSPTGVDGPIDLKALADELLDEARGLRSGRSARTLIPGAGAPHKQSLLALTAGQRLQDHVAPGPTTLLALRGTSVLSHGGDAVTLSEDMWAECPTDVHSLEAVSDTVVLLTVTPTGTPTEATDPDA